MGGIGGGGSLSASGASGKAAAPAEAGAVGVAPSHTAGAAGGPANQLNNGKCLTHQVTAYRGDQQPAEGASLSSPGFGRVCHQHEEQASAGLPAQHVFALYSLHLEAASHKQCDWVQAATHRHSAGLQTATQQLEQMGLAQLPQVTPPHLRQRAMLPTPAQHPVRLGSMTMGLHALLACTSSLQPAAALQHQQQPLGQCLHTQLGLH